MLHSQISFEPRVKISRSTAEVGVADFNMDGFPDIAISNASQRWYEGPEFTDWHLIGTSDGGPYAARVADMNGDGWADFVTSDGTRNAADMPGNIYLYLNPGPNGDPTEEWARITVYTGQVRHQNDMRLADMDGDGLMDIIEKTWSSERVVVSLQNPDINNWTTRVFDTSETGKPEGISAGDLDGDGEMEIILSGVYWDNPGGWRSGDPIQYTIDTDFIQEEVKSAVGDIDNDGDNDVYMGSCEGTYKFLAWYENEGLDENGGVIFTKQIIKPNTGKYHMVELIDIDYDGDLDLATGKSFGDDGCVIFYNNDNGNSWTESVYDENGNLYTGIVADLDGDGDYDIVGPEGFEDPVYYYINQGNGELPSAPINLQAVLVDGLEIVLSWEDESVNETLFQIEVFHNDTWLSLDNISPNNTSYTHDSTVPDSTYQYRIRSANSSGVSSWDSSNIVQTWSQLDDVIISPSGGNYLFSPTISLNVNSENEEEIRYTIDGSIPNNTSAVYIAPFILESSNIVKSIATSSGFINSNISEETYNIAIDGNFPPIANAGEDIISTDLSPILLDGTQSEDFDDPIQNLVFNWLQIEGPTVDVLNNNSSIASFSPTVAGDYQFQLSVSDEVIASKDTVSISVQDLSENLIAYWPLDESSGTVANEIISSKNAAINGTFSWLPNGGQVDGGLFFDGTNGRAEIPSFDVSGTEMTITMWIKIPSYDFVEARILSKATGTNANNHLWMVSQNGGSAIRFRLNTSSGATTTLISNTGEIPLNQWIFIAAKYDGSTMKIYKNGTEITSTPKTGNITQSTANIAIGNQPFGAGDRPFSGSIDDVRIYDVALSDSDIENIYVNSCSKKLTIQDTDISEDSTFSAKDEIVLDNVTVLGSSTLELKAKQVSISTNCYIAPNVNLIIKYIDGCQDLNE